MAKNFNIIIVGNNPENCRPLEALLVSKGYQAHFLSTDMANPETLMESSPDLVLLDLTALAGSSLSERLASLSRFTKHTNLPVIILASDNNLEFELLDVYDYLVHPVDKNRLLTDIRRLVGQKPTGSFSPAILSDQELALYQTFLDEHSGLHFSRRNTRMLERGLHRRMCAIGAESYSEYYDYLLTFRESRNELKKLLSLLTVGETTFFRYSNQRSAFIDHILPDLISRRRHSRSLRIWSAGCSTGEEPYSIAMLLTEQFPELKNWDIRIMATDINKRSLRSAREGIYGRRAVRLLDNSYLNKYFSQAGNLYVLNRGIKDMVTFGYLNLQEEQYPSPLNGTAELDLVLCRNVMIYFQLPTMRRIVECFSRCLRQNGYLMLGHAETLQNISDRFQRLQKNKAFFYQLRKQSKSILDETGKKEETREKQLPATVDVTRVLEESKAAKKMNVQKTYLDAQAAFRREEFVLAERLYASVLAESPEHLRALIGKGLIKANQGLYDEARKCCARTISIDDLFADAYFLKGLILDMEEQVERAVVEYQKALWLDPYFVAARYALTRISLRKGHKHEVRRELLNTIKCLEKERPSAIILYSGGMTREVFLELCRNDLAALPAAN